VGYLRTIRRLGRDVQLFMLTAALVGLTVFGGISAVLMNLYLLRLGFGPDFIGVFIATGNIAFAAVCVPAGVMGARWGARRAMVAGLTLASVGGAATALSELVPPEGRAAWLLITNVVGASGMAIYLVNSSPFLVAATTLEARSRAFSLQAALWPLAGFVGSLLGGVLPGMVAAATGAGLDEPWPFGAPLLLSALLLLPGALALLAARDPEPAQEQVEVQGGQGRAPVLLITVMSAVILFQIVGEGVARSFTNVYLDAGLGLPAAQIGLLLAVAQLVAAPAALVTPHLAERWGQGRTFAVGSVAMAFSLLPLALVPHWAAAGLGYLGLVVTASVSRPAINVLQMEIVAPRWRPAIAAAASTAAGISLAAVGFGGGLVITNAGYSVLFLIGAGCTLVGTLIFWLYFGRQSTVEGRPAGAANSL
jgi:MFS family permease